MKTILVASMLLGASASSPTVPPPRGPLATIPGTCTFTHVVWVGHRLRDDPAHPGPNDSGSAVVLANGVYGVDYVDVPAIVKTRVGDRVMTSLASLPRHCPPGDARGKVYTTTNLRTGEAWSLPDAEHQCGGA